MSNVLFDSIKTSIADNGIMVRELKKILISVHPETRNFGQGQGTRRLYPQKYIEVFRGLQSECDAEIVQKGRFWMSTN